MEENIITPHPELIMFGGSAGSLEVLLQLLPALNKGLSIPILIIMHRKDSNDSLLAELFSSRSNLYVVEAEEKEPILPGTVYIAPANYHLLIEQDRTFSLDDSEKVNYSRPSIDVSFESAAEVYGPGLTAILLSGANADGVEGLKAVKKHGGVVIAQDPDTAEVSYMPRQAAEHIDLDHMLDARGIADYLNSIL